MLLRAKSRARIIDPVKAAEGIVLVTHDMSCATEFRNRALVLEQGHVVADRDAARVTELHQEHSKRSQVARAATTARRTAEIDTAAPRTW